MATQFLGTAALMTVRWKNDTPAQEVHSDLTPVWHLHDTYMIRGDTKHMDTCVPTCGDAKVMPGHLSDTYMP